MSDLYGGRTAQELAQLRDAAPDYVSAAPYYNGVDVDPECSAFYTAAYAALPDLLARLRAAEEAREKAERRAAAASESLSIEHRRSQDLYRNLYSIFETDGGRASLAKHYPDLEAARVALLGADAREGRGDD